jgi:hypothetical protein
VRDNGGMSIRGEMGKGCSRAIYMLEEGYMPDSIIVVLYRVLKTISFLFDIYETHPITSIFFTYSCVCLSILLLPSTAYENLRCLLTTNE